MKTRLTLREKKRCIKIHGTRGFLRCRVRDPKDFQEGTFKIKRVAKGVLLVLGKRPGREVTETQSILFDRRYFTL